MRYVCSSIYTFAVFFPSADFLLRNDDDALHTCTDAKCIGATRVVGEIDTWKTSRERETAVGFLQFVIIQVATPHHLRAVQRYIFIYSIYKALYRLQL